MSPESWQSLLDAVSEIQEWFPDGIVFIGGIAVYAHASNDPENAEFAAQSHDADFMILLPDFVDLRDIEALTPNRRLGKQQFVKNGFEFDVYVESQHDLAIPAGEAVAESVVRSGLRVACPEHLLVLKAKAMRDRKGSPKGDKDEDDVVRILMIATEVDAGRLTRLTDEMFEELEAAVSGDAPMRLAAGNSHRAKAIREKARTRLDDVRHAHRINYGTPVP
ncbi:hypothetical protein ACIQW5_18500 [Methylorubrum thiocyanatum]|uniref:hypothetical protein n=1 Tax=Methylorubrum thiocyanatum TaxID=47958 RepID=UPI00383BD2CF